MDPTAADVRAGTATYDANTGLYAWLPGQDPSQFSAGTVLSTPVQPVWDSGTGSAVVTVTAPPKTDHSILWLLLAAGAAVWLMES